MTRKRFRDLGFSIGKYQVGALNAITDVSGVRVGQVTLNSDSPRSIHTGITVVLPKGVWKNYSSVGYFLLNGNGDSTGLELIDEYGHIAAPIAFTNTHQIGLVRDCLVKYYRENISRESFEFPLVTETDDSWISDNDSYPITAEHVFQAINSAMDGPIEEGNVGAGTGVICFDFKGGIGTSSRLVKILDNTYTIGVITQTNFGNREDFIISGVPIGTMLKYDKIPNPWKDQYHSQGSVVVVVATDAPLNSGQCSRVAKRATLGLGRIGCKGHDNSGDIVIAFASGNQIPTNQHCQIPCNLIPNENLDALFEAVIEATEEAVINSLTAANSMVGKNGRKVDALPLDFLVEVLGTHHPRR